MDVFPLLNNCNKYTISSATKTTATESVATRMVLDMIQEQDNGSSRIDQDSLRRKKKYRINRRRKTPPPTTMT